MADPEPSLDLGDIDDSSKEESEEKQLEEPPVEELPCLSQELPCLSVHSGVKDQEEEDEEGRRPSQEAAEASLQWGSTGDSRHSERSPAKMKACRKTKRMRRMLTKTNCPDRDWPIRVDRRTHAEKTEEVQGCEQLFTICSANASCEGIFYVLLLNFCIIS